MRIDVDLPKGWEDLSPEQVLYITKLLTENLTVSAFLTDCFFYFSGWKLLTTGTSEFIFKQGKEKFTVDADLFHTLCSELLWLKNSVGACVNPPCIGKAYGCDRELYDVTLEQYLFADAHYKVYGTTQDINHLAYLTATFYFKKRQHFDADKIVNKRYRYFLKYPTHLQSVLLWYTGTKVMLKEKFPELYKQIEDGAGGEAYDAEKIYLNTLSSLNAGRVVDNDKVLASRCIEALNELNLKNKQAIEHKKNMKK